MTFDLQRILKSKRALRRKLAAQPVAEKLRMLDDLRERALTIRRASFTARAESVRVQETSGKYAPRPKERKPRC